MENGMLASLPDDIALQILQYIAVPQKFGALSWPSLVHGIPEGESLRTIQSVRLTCRALSRLAAPVLFPVLHVSINYKSVDAFEKLSKNPVIATHARGVVVNVATYSRDLAMDLGAFKKSRLTEIHQLSDSLDYHMEFRLQEGDEEDDDVQEYHRLSHRLNILKQEWDHVAPTESDNTEFQADSGAAGGAAKSQFGDILLSSYNEYVRRFREQLEWLSDAQSMVKLANAFKRLDCGGKVHFSAKVREVVPYRGGGLEIAEVLDNPQVLSRLMAQPYSWEDLERRGEEKDLGIARTLTMLPIALADVGVPLTELYLGCFPHYSGFTQLLSHEKQQAAELELQLRSAFQQIQVFHFGYSGMSCKGLRHNPLPDRDVSYMRAYLQAALASSQLQNLSMSFYSYCINTGQRRNDEGLFVLGPVLQSLTTFQLTRVVVSNVEVKFDELEYLLTRLGSKLGFLSLGSIALLDGRWAPLLDVVRESTAQRCQEDRCRVILSNLLGAEFGSEKRKHLDIWNTDPDEWEEELKEPASVREAERYLCGKRATNPLQRLDAAAPSLESFASFESVTDSSSDE
ncbi:hypothetical protein V2A60_007566 [Cordyceps javanica]|uniref:F-box domain-containing protein n=1 Tax=Cordyceps javanica TaxID=43265 RepID=A0A545VAJ4_9HYPO|nr:hypothetical protein IF1G_02808 [Cordyceps javanica]TQW09939.1 hypothetical protein IF2G_02729 [Cordyceps javanica]